MAQNQAAKDQKRQQQFIMLATLVGGQIEVVGRAVIWAWHRCQNRTNTQQHEHGGCPPKAPLVNAK
eukprot:11174708-Lingulodinium_polyedra.AAC.1